MMKTKANFEIRAEIPANVTDKSNIFFRDPGCLLSWSRDLYLWSGWLCEMVWASFCQGVRCKVECDGRNQTVHHGEDFSSMRLRTHLQAWKRARPLDACACVSTQVSSRISRLKALFCKETVQAVASLEKWNAKICNQMGRKRLTFHRKKNVEAVVSSVRPTSEHWSQKKTGSSFYSLESEAKES